MKKFREFLDEENETREMREIKEIYEKEYYGTIDESGAGLSRILKMLEDGNDFLIITASRANKSKKENLANNNKLIKDIRSKVGKKIGAYKLVGHWKECNKPLKKGETIKDCKGSIVNSMEESWLITRPERVSREEFSNIAQDMAKKYDQDAYIIRLNGKLTVNDKNGEIWEDLGKANKKSISAGFERIIDVQGYSELAKLRKKGRITNIIFEDLYLVVPKDSNSSKMLFSSAKILY